ncbi:hypothetical protein [Clostridium sardiniense]|uniref:hypothetical protein n=1 Tax=Clostridium sardiniense TaxID=29369 RepID=UPI003D35958B
MRAAGISFIGTMNELKERVQDVRIEYCVIATELYFNGYEKEEAFVKAKEIFNKKVHPQTVQSLGNEHDEITFKSILPLNCDIDNGEIYDKLTGETIREL